MRQNAVSALHATEYRFKFEITGELPASLERLRLGALQLSNGYAQGMLLKAAASDTLLPAFRRRFLANALPANMAVRRRLTAALPGMINMRREKFQRADAAPGANIVRRYLRASQAMDSARARGDKKALASAKVTLTNARESLRIKLKPPRPSKNPLPHGQFRRLAMRVLELIADVNQAKTFSVGATVVLGMGNVEMLDRIKTPSATQQLTGRPTKSIRNILWRHLEFGTGAFASAPSLQQSQHRLAGGGWWYGRSKKQALQLRGSRAGKMLGDPARNLRHQPESVQFISNVNEFMTTALFGN